MVIHAPFGKPGERLTPDFLFIHELIHMNFGVECVGFEAGRTAVGVSISSSWGGATGLRRASCSENTPPHTRYASLLSMRSSHRLLLDA